MYFESRNNDEISGCDKNERGEDARVVLFAK